jgi:hypothetical protein
MTWRRRQRRRLIWAGALFGLVLLLATVSVLRAAVWTRDLLNPNSPNLRGANP